MLKIAVVVQFFELVVALVRLPIASAMPIVSNPFPVEFNQRFTACLAQDQKNVKPMMMFKQAIAILDEFRITYTLECHPKLMFVHQKNRASLGLSWHNVHRNGAKIYSVGADLKQLTNAYAFEMQPDGELRAAQIEKNSSLIRRSGGLLAEPSGFERMVTVGCGHTVAFCRAAKALCRTPQAEIADENGQIDCSKLCKDAQLGRMINVGWPWTIIPAKIDELYPEFADIAQKALNASNHVATMVGEIEVSKTVADIMMDGKESWEQDAIAVVQSMGAPSAPYAKTLMEYVKTYGGGAGAPLIVLVDSVAKTFQCNATLGESYWKAVVQLSFYDKYKKHPLIRVGLILANLTSPKSEDGIAKLLVKGDVSKVANKQNAPEAASVETTLEEGLHIMQTLVKANQLLDQTVGPIGRLLVRAVLKLVKKEKEGREAVEYSYEEIKNKYLQELSAESGKPVGFGKWDAEVKAAQAAEPATGTEAARPAAKPIASALHELSDPVIIASQHGFKVGDIVSERMVEGGLGPESLFTIKHISDITELVTTCAYNHDPMTVKIQTIGGLTEGWAKRNADPPYLLTVGESRVASSIKVDRMKAALYVAVAESGEHATTGLEFYRRPDRVYTIERFNKGALVLGPMTGLANITTKNTGNTWLLGTFDNIEYYAIPPPKAPNDKDGHKDSLEKWKADYHLAAFWWIVCDITDDEDEANMEVVSKRFGGKTINVLQNSEGLAANTRLRIYKEPKAVQTPLQNVISKVAQSSVPAPTSRKRGRGS